MSIKKNLFYNIILKVTNVVFPFITVPYISRVLGPDGLGVASFATTYASYFALFAALGIPTYGIREIAKVHDTPQQEGKIFSELFVLNMLSVVFFSFVYLSSIYIVPQLSAQKEPLLAAGIMLFLSSFTIDWFFSGREAFKAITIRSIVIKIISAFGLFIFVKEKNDIIPYILLTVFASVGNQIWNFIMLAHSNIIISIKNLNFRRHIKPIFYLYASSIAISIYTMLDTLMLGFMSSYAEVGYYSAATRISKLFLPIVTALGTVLLPRLSYYQERSLTSEIRKALQSSFSFVVLSALPLTVGIILIAPDFVPFFFGYDFHGAILSLQIMALLIIVIGLNNLSGVQILVGLGYDKLFMRSVLYGVVVNFCLNLFLIPHYGALGASIASVVAETLILFVTAFYAKKYANISFFSFKVLIKNIGVVLLFIPAYFVLHSLGLTTFYFLIWFILICIIIYISIQYIVIREPLVINTVGVVLNKIKNLK